MECIFLLLDRKDLDIRQENDIHYTILVVVVGYAPTPTPEEQNLSIAVIETLLDREDSKPDINIPYYFKPIWNCIDCAKLDIIEYLITHYSTLSLQ